MKKLNKQYVVKFCDEIKKELLLVIWPTKKDMIVSVGVVSIAVLLSASIFFATDYVLYNIVQFLIKL